MYNRHLISQVYNFYGDHLVLIQNDAMNSDKAVLSHANY